MNEYYVYVYLDPRKPMNILLEDVNVKFDFEPFYFGKGKNKRYKSHLNDPRSKNTLKTKKIQRIRDAGFEPLVIKIFENLIESDAMKYEKQLIASIGTKWNIKDIKRGPLCNMTSGGDGWTICEEAKEKARIKSTGSNNYMYGKTHTPEAKAKISITSKAHRHSEKTKKAMSEARNNGKNYNVKKWILITPELDEIKISHLARILQIT